MSHKVSPGISRAELSGWLKAAAERYGRFDDGRVNYKDADIAPVVMCTLKCGDEIFLAKRGQGLADANGFWSTINGFIDEDKPVAEIAAQEFREELGLEIRPADIKVGVSYTMDSQLEKRRYIVFPCLVVIDKKPEIKLDYEHTDYTWIKREDLEKYDILDDLPLVIDSALKLL
jgi:8-oxo-dGTP pyrophosphatase MutT (NUDIX family)